MNQHELIQDQLAEHDRNAVRSHYDEDILVFKYKGTNVWKVGK